jgi:hypothetical protein
MDKADWAVVVEGDWSVLFGMRVRRAPFRWWNLRQSKIRDGIKGPKDVTSNDGPTRPIEVTSEPVWVRGLSKGKSLITSQISV